MYVRDLCMWICLRLDYVIKLYNICTAGNPQFSNPGDMSRPEREESIGARLSLKCRASGTPKPKYMWFKDNVRLTIYDGKFSILCIT